MSPPVWSVGQVLLASDVNNWFVPGEADKAAATHYTGTTLANDPDLALPVAANAKYLLELYVAYTGAGPTFGNGDLKASFTAPSGTNWSFQIIAYNGAGNDVSRLSWQNGSTPFIWGTEGSGVPRGALVKGLVATSGTSGNIQWQFAQNTPNATDSIVLAQSYFKLQRVG